MRVVTVRGRLALAAVVPALVLGSVGGVQIASGSAPVRSAPAVAAHRAAPAPQLRHHGRWLVDRHGRVMILHGVNLVYKHAPFVAPATQRGFTARDARFLASHGLDAVRLGVLFQGVMPHPGVINHHYLKRIDRIVRLLAAQRIYVLLDFHQDAFSQKFAGEGFPGWSVHDDGLPFSNLGSFFVNDQQPAVETAFDHVWNNQNRLWHYYTKAWVAVAKKWRHQPYLMGYDLFNEPSAGTQMATCATPEGCPLFDATLQKFYDHVRTAIRRVDPRNLVWYEPQFLFNAISASHFGRINDSQAALSWHDYACTPAFVAGGIIPGDPDCVVNEPRVMTDAEQQMGQMGAGGMMTEFGAGDDLEDLARLTKDADHDLFGWMYWAYKTWNDPTGSADEGLFSNDAKMSTVKAAKVRVLVHPYPQVVAGIPTAMSWNPVTRVLTFSYRPRPGIGPTEVFVPRLDYPHGYTVEVRGGTVQKGRPRMLYVAAGRIAKSVEVTVRPRG